jgi:ketosteroid isomerase-like protein
MNSVALVTRVVDRILAQDPEAALDLIADDVAFVVTNPEGDPGRIEARGKEAVADYFRSLGAIVTFWRTTVVANGDRVLVLGDESFVVNGRVQIGSDFEFLVDVRDGLISRFEVVENAAAVWVA